MRFGGSLTDYLERNRAAGRSWRWLEADINAATSLAVSRETLRQWGDALGIPEPERAAS